MFAKSLISLSLLVALSAPVFVFATTGLVPCGKLDAKNNDTGAAGADGKVDDPCGFNDTITLVQKIISFLIKLGVSAAALGFAYAGFLYITAMGSEEKIKHAHSIFLKVIWGFVFMLSAWLIAKTLEDAFLRQEYKNNSFLFAPVKTKIITPLPADIRTIN